MKKILALIMLSTSLSFAVRVGVLGYPLLCPERTQLELLLDAEDHNNISGIVDGYHKVPYGISFALGRVGFIYCRVPDSYLVPCSVWTKNVLPAVISLGVIMIRRIITMTTLLSEISRLV